MVNAIIDYIAKSNLFNFVIFAAIIIWVCKIIDVSGKLESAKNSVKEHIDFSGNAKTESEDYLKSIEESVAHIEEEITEIIRKSEENAGRVGEKILEDAGRTVNGIKENLSKAAENRAALLKNDILRRASEASIEVARNHIINELNNNYDLHNKLIDESIESVGGNIKW